MIGCLNPSIASRRACAYQKSNSVNLNFPRSLPPVIWWVLAFVMVGIAIIWLPKQCVSSDESPSALEEETKELPVANQDKELEFRKDGLWYEIGSGEAFSGIAESYYENGSMKTRTKVQDGKAYGLIEEWDDNGTLTGPRFKDEFPK